MTPEPTHPKLSVVVPAYRVPGEVGATVQRLRAELHGFDPEVEIVVVDDGSEDGTDRAAWDGGADQVIVQARNKGKGAAVRAGMLAARGDVRVFTDVDLAYPPDQVRRVAEAVAAGNPIAVGSRHHVDTTTVVRARRLREVTGRVFNAVTRVLVLGENRDTQCGLKGFSGAAADAVFSRCRIDGFAFDVELFVVARRLGLPVHEVPVEVSNSEDSTVRVSSAALQMVRDVLTIRRLDRSGAYGPDVTTSR